MVLNTAVQASGSKLDDLFGSQEGILHLEIGLVGFVAVAEKACIRDQKGRKPIQKRRRRGGEEGPESRNTRENS